MTEKLSDLAPKPRLIHLKNGVVARVGLFTLEHVVEAEERYGSFEKMMTETEGRTTRDMIDMVYMIIENKHEVGTVEEFMRQCPVTELTVPKTVELLVWAAGFSLPEKTAGAGGVAGKQGKSTGGTASRPSRGTTRTSSTKS